MLDLSDTKTKDLITQMANHYGLTPKKLPRNISMHGFGDYQKWFVRGTKSKSGVAVNFYNTVRENRVNHIGMSHEGQPKASYQLALNILHDEELRTSVGLIL